MIERRKSHTGHFPIWIENETCVAKGHAYRPWPDNDEYKYCLRCGCVDHYLTPQERYEMLVKIHGLPEGSANE